VEWRECDLTDFDEVRRLLAQQRPEIVLHLASHVAGSRALDLVRPTFTANVVSTVALLAAAVESGVERVVLAGSLEEPEGPMEAVVPASPYAAAKWAASGYARMFHALYELDVAVARIFMVYGPGQRDEKKLIPYVIRSLLNGQAPEVSSGVRPVDWIYVDDVVAGLVRIAESERVGGKRVDLGSGVMVTVREVVLELARLIPGAPEPRFGAIEDRAMEQVRVANVAETRRILGWQPGTELTAGLQATIDWYADRMATE
jgi:nucleoside-diphosphate-sugar epimerase